jgi:hypothetical protein
MEPPKLGAHGVGDYLTVPVFGDNPEVSGELVGPGLRIALREAVGGWGPYSVREIHDLFSSYGFFDFDPNQEDVGGVRRSAADAFHSRIDFTDPEVVDRYLDLISEVLEHYPEGNEEAAAGKKLRRQLSRYGIDFDASGRLRLQSTDTVAASELEKATQGVWTPDRMRVFMSHTSKHRDVVGRLSTFLNESGMSCFVAHDAIEPSRDWQQVIEAALSTCDAFVGLVTLDFPQSRWTDQEVGWAMGRGIPVVPIRYGLDPYGFFGSYQAVSMTDQDASFPARVAAEVVRALSVAIYRAPRPHAPQLRKAMAGVVAETLSNSPNFDSTRQRLPLLELVPGHVWTDQQLARLEAAASSNRQIEQAIIPPGRPAPDVINEFTAAIRRKRPA